MIAYIRGTLAEKEPTRIIVEAAGVGYELLISLSTYDQLPREGEEVKLLVSHVIREDDEILFGFAATNEKEMFLKLTSVSGVGPKIAIAILSGSSIGELSMAIAAGDAKRISSIKGVGKKTAEKICVELKDKVNPLEALSTTSSKGGPANPALRDAVMALQALGFGPDVAAKMVADVVEKIPDAKDVETIIKTALGGKNK